MPRCQDIKRRFEQQEWSPATVNRYRALLSLTYRLAIRTVRYSHLAPKYTLAAVDRLDAPAESPTDTTTDTSAFQQPAVVVPVLQ